MACNVHWQSDVNEGRFMGAATTAPLHADHECMGDLERAEREVARLKGAE